jgi:hypothetical protein
MSLWLCDTTGWELLSGRVTPTQNILRLADWERIIHMARATSGFSDVDIHDGRLSVVFRAAPGSPWQHLPVLERSVSYLVEHTPAASLGPRREVGLVALETLRGDSEPSEEDLARAASLLADPAAVPTLRPIARQGRTVLAEYDLIHGNALKNITNRYVLTPEEREVARCLGHPAADGGGLCPLALAPGRAAFAVRLRARHGTYHPADLKIEVEWHAGLARARLLGNALRGHNGVGSTEVWGSAVTLVERDSGESITLPIHPAGIGGWYSATLPPWQGPLVPVREGTYALTFTAADIRFWADPPGEGPIAVELPGELVAR